MSGLFKPTVLKGTRITDFAKTSADVGGTIPFLYGRAPVPGNVGMAKLPPTETKTTKKQGKGGVKQEIYTYDTTYAILFCRGPIRGYWWIKRNGKVVYSIDPAVPIEDQAYAAKWAAKVQMYNGTMSQMPSSVIEAIKGVGRVSAMRGMAYIVVPRDDVTEGGGALPVYEAVPIASPAEGYITSHPYAQTFSDAGTAAMRPVGGEMRSVVFKGKYVDLGLVGLAPSGGELKTWIPPEARERVVTGLAPSGGEHKLPPLGLFTDRTTSAFAPSGGVLFNPPMGHFFDEAVTGFVPTGGELSGTPSPPVDVDGDVVFYLRPAGTDGDITFTDESGLSRAITRTGSETVESDGDAEAGTVLHIPVSSPGLRLAHIAADDARTGAFQVDWKLKLPAPFVTNSMTIFTIAEVGTYGQAYEWSVLVGADYIQLYFGMRGYNQAHYQFYFGENIDLRANNIVGEQMDMSLARDASGNIGAWFNGIPSTRYRYSPTAVSVSFGAITTGTPVNTVDLGATAIPYAWIGGSAGGVHAGNDIAYDLNEVTYNVGGARAIGVAYTPVYPSDPIPTDDVLVDLQFNAYPLVDSSPYAQAVTEYGSITYNGDGTITRNSGYSAVYTSTSPAPRMRDFYIEMKFTPSSTGGEQIFVDTRRIDNGQGGIAILTHPTFNLVASLPSGNSGNSGVMPTIGVENLVEYSRVDLVGYLFLNGVLIATLPDANDYHSPVFCVGGATYSPVGAAGTPGWIYNYAKLCIGTGHIDDHPIWHDIVEGTSFANDPTWDGYSLRVFVPSIHTEGASKARITFRGPPSGAATVISAARVGTNSDGTWYYEAADSVAVSFSGSSSVTLGIDEEVTVELDMPAGIGANLVIGMDISSGDASRSTVGSSVEAGWRTGSYANSTGSIGVLTADGGNLYVVSKIELLS